MKPALEQERVLATISTLCKGDRTVPVAIGAIHERCPYFDVRDLVGHIQILLSLGFIENAGRVHDGISNRFCLTAAGKEYCSTQPHIL